MITFIKNIHTPLSSVHLMWKRRSVISPTLHKQSLAANHVSASTTTRPIDREVVNRLLFMIRQCTGTLPDVLAVLPGPRRLWQHDPSWWTVGDPWLISEHWAHCYRRYCLPISFSFSSGVMLKRALSNNVFLTSCPSLPPSLPPLHNHTVVFSKIKKIANYLFIQHKQFDCKT